MIKDALIAELKHESSMTKKMLEAVPLERQDWAPHKKSKSLGELALHVARIPSWVSRIIHHPDFDMATTKFPPYHTVTKEDLLEAFKENVDKALADLNDVTDENLNTMWKFRMGDYVVFEMPRKVSIRNLAFNHLYHHRGQLSVYLRLLEVPVPGMYGPSADEKM